MQLGLINATWSQAGKETAFGIRKTKEIGFDVIDIFADPLETDAEERRLIRTECEQVGLPIVSVPCVALGLADFNPSVRRFHLMRTREYLKLCHELGARNLLLVIGEYIWNREVIPPERQWGWAVENLKELGDDAAGYGLEIVLEMEPFDQALLRGVDDMSRFLDQVGHPQVLANVDISHMVLAKQSPEKLQDLKGRVGHVHISDCDGKVHGDLPPGRGVVPFTTYLEAIRQLEMPEDATISVELEYAPDPDRIVEWVEEAYRVTARLMAAAGLRTATA